MILDIIWTSSRINDIYSINQKPWKSVFDAQNNWNMSADSVDALEFYIHERQFICI